MTNIFGSNIASIVANALAPLVFDQILIKTVSVRDPANSTRSIKTEVPYPCRGFVDNFSNESWQKTSIRITDAKIVILGATLPAGIVPESGDRITAEGKTFTIQENGVMRDAASATYECHSR